MQVVTNLVDLIRQRAQDAPGAVAYRFLRDGERETGTLTFGELEEAVLGLAGQLQDAGLGGKQAILLFPSGLQYLTALLACFCAGTIAVPAYPPRSARNLPRIEAIMADSNAAAILTESTQLGALQAEMAQALRVGVMVTDFASGRYASWADPQLSSESIAYLQYTSGSTGVPKGVVVTHGNLLHNASRICESFHLDRNSRFVSWLPFFHDLGLIYGLLVPLYAGGSGVLMSSAAFLQRPYRWLKAISDYRGTVSGGPNFAYDLCVDRISEHQRADLDLSTWRTALNGAEPVRANTLRAFSEVFAVSGFRSQTHKPSYGLAEATLVVSCTPDDASAVTVTVDSHYLETQDMIVEVPADHERASVKVASGRPFGDQQTAIVDSQSGRALPEGRVGEIWVSGKSVANGYWGRPEESRETFQARCSDHPDMQFLRTGDLGFLYRGSLFVAGRIKDVIVVRGRNLYPQDIEAVVESSHNAIRASCTAAFSVDVDEEEQLVVVAELQHRNAIDCGQIADSVVASVSEAFEVAVHCVEFIAPGTLPKTSSGKVQRALVRRRHVDRGLPTVFRTDGKAIDGGRGDAGLEGLLRREFARILRVGVTKIDSGKPLTMMGLDSLSAAALVDVIDSKLGIRYQMGALFGGTTIASLVTSLSSQVQECRRNSQFRGESGDNQGAFAEAVAGSES